MTLCPGRLRAVGLGLIVTALAAAGLYWNERRKQSDRFVAVIDGYAIVVNAIQDFYWVNGKVPKSGEIPGWIERRGLKSNPLVRLLTVTYERDGILTIAHIQLSIDGKKRGDGPNPVRLVRCGAPRAGLSVWLRDGSSVTRSSADGCPPIRHVP